MKRFISTVLILFAAVLVFACHAQSSPEASVPTPGAASKPVSTPEGEDTLEYITPVPTDTPEPQTPTPSPTPSPSPTPTPTPSPTPEPDGLIGWTKGGFVPREETSSTETEYTGENLHFTVTTVEDETTYKGRVTYYVTDIYLRDIHCLRTSAATTFQSVARDGVSDMAKRVNALLAISGDMYNAHKHSLVIRNGEIFDKKLYSNWEVCFLYLDGTMETMTADEYKSATLRDDIWQAWQFGPSLLDEDGHAKTKFPQSQVNPQNPRCAIGYIEPGHYCFVTVDGRQKQSRGMELVELANLMESLGCKVAYNLDGGKSASLYWNGDIYSKPVNGGREMSDIVYLIDVDDSVS
ncbi:MAG: phosphodiester glycosidase family protein [Clostridia bacterium]|nr:phosphodiester glycosidase family protein [Clostridia bacterium]